MNRNLHDVVFKATSNYEFTVEFYYADTMLLWMCRTFYDWHQFKKFYEFVKSVKTNRNTVLLYNQDKDDFDGFREVYLLVIYDDFNINDITVHMDTIVDPTSNKTVSLDDVEDSLETV